MSKLNFSVCMCVYMGDKSEYFQEALESVYNQTLMPDEVVLVVDGPIPTEIDQVINNYQEKYAAFNVLRLKENQGHGKARRFGLSKCKYEYVAIVDSDDINVRSRFETQLKYFEINPRLSAVSSGCYHFTGTIKNIINEEKLPTTDLEIKKYLKTRCPLCQASTILKKEEVDKAGGYLDWYHAEDYYLWVRMYLNGAQFANTQENLLYIRSDPDQIGRRGGYKYYRSLKKLYRFMLENRVINFPIYVLNVSSRFIMQVLLPDNVRAFVRKKLL